jgi:hypothetical protein
MVVLFRLVGTIFSAHPKTLSRAPGVRAGAGVLDALGVLCLDRSHEGSKAETRCMAAWSTARLREQLQFSPGSRH